MLCLTSNPEGAEVQHVGGRDSVAGRVATWAAGRTRRSAQRARRWGPSVSWSARRPATRPASWVWTSRAVHGPLLAPGVGAQGAGAPELRRVFGGARGVGAGLDVPCGARRRARSWRSLRGAARRATADAAAAAALTWPSALAGQRRYRPRCLPALPTPAHLARFVPTTRQSAKKVTRVALPPLTPEQRAAALEKAAAARQARAEVKNRLKYSQGSLAEVIEQGRTDEVIGKLKVSALLESLARRRQDQGPRDHGGGRDLREPPPAGPRPAPGRGPRRALRLSGRRTCAADRARRTDRGGQGHGLGRCAGALPGGLAVGLRDHPDRRVPVRSTGSTTTSSAPSGSTRWSRRGSSSSGPWCTAGTGTAPRGGRSLEHLAPGVPALLEIDLPGRARCARAMPEARFVFLAPPSWDELERRLVGRGTEDAEERERRLATARVELAAEAEFDHTIVNDDVQRATDELVEVMGLTAR